MNAALSLHITISDTTAGALIERFGSREGATDALAGLARQKRRPGLRGSARVADLRALERRIEEISAARSESLNQLNRRSAEAASRFLEQLVGSADAEHVSERLETLWRDIRQLRGLTEAAPQDPIRQQTVSVLRVFPPEPAEWLEAVAA